MSKLGQIVLVALKSIVGYATVDGKDNVRDAFSADFHEKYTLFPVATAEGEEAETVSLYELVFGSVANGAKRVCTVMKAVQRDLFDAGENFYANGIEYMEPLTVVDNGNGTYGLADGTRRYTGLIVATAMGADYAQGIPVHVVAQEDAESIAVARLANRKNPSNLDVINIMTRERIKTGESWEKIAKRVNLVGLLGRLPDENSQHAINVKARQLGTIGLLQHENKLALQAEGLVEKEVKRLKGSILTEKEWYGLHTGKTALSKAQAKVEGKLLGEAGKKQTRDKKDKSQAATPSTNGANGQPTATGTVVGMTREEVLSAVATNETLTAFVVKHGVESAHQMFLDGVAFGLRLAVGFSGLPTATPETPAETVAS